MASLHKGAELPEDTIINSEGQPSRVPRQLYEGGTLMAVGGAGHGHKGSALSIMVDVLGGILSGTGPSYGVEPERRPFFNNGVFFLCIDPAVLRPFGDFLSDVELLKRSVRAALPREGESSSSSLPPPAATTRQHDRTHALSSHPSRAGAADSSASQLISQSVSQ
eukprot:SAG25_NODE_5270_length_680_cov_1.110155_1_plen_164_part_01